MGGILIPQGEVRILSSAAVGGYEERRGPFGECFDLCAEDDRFGQTSYELAEGEMARIALSLSLGKLALSEGALDLLLSGDLQNQCVASSQGPACARTPFLGLFGACSTMIEGLGIGMLALSGAEALSLVGAVTSSHNAAAERQFRTPLEYGAQRTPTAQWTATAAGAIILGREGGMARITAFLPGRVTDAGIRDAANMGAAMAPSAADTLCRFFDERESGPEDYDLILTGDLGQEGSELLYTLLSGRFPTLCKCHKDGGLMLYDRTRQDVHAGGSGCGCIASMLSAAILPEVASGRIRRMLAIGTGALMNPGSIQQGGTIAGVAHLIEITGVSEWEK